MTDSKKSFIKRALKILLWTILSLIALLIVIILTLRLPYVQQKITDRASTYLSEKTGTTIHVDRLFITFTGKVALDGLYVEDLQGDTLLYSGQLESGVQVIPLIRGKIQLRSTDWSNLKANIYRSQGGDFNFQFLLDAFRTQEDEVVISEESNVEETSEITLRAGPVNLLDFAVIYRDDELGIDAQMTLGELNIQPRDLDLQKFNFELSKVSWSDTKIQYVQTMPFPPANEDEAPGILPGIIVDELELHNIDITYDSRPDELLAELVIGDFLLELPLLNLAEKKVEVNTLELLNSIVKVQGPQAEEIEQQMELSDTLSIEEVFEITDWQVQVHRIVLENNNITVGRGSPDLVEGTFNPDFFSILNLNLALDSVKLTAQEARAHINSFTFSERSGLALKSLSGKFHLQEKSLSVKSLTVETDETNLSADALLTFESLNALINKPFDSKIDLSIEDGLIGIADVFYIAPELRRNKEMAILEDKPLYINSDINGVLNDLKIQNLIITWGNQTSFVGSGRIRGLPEIEDLKFDLPDLKFKSIDRDMALFLGDSLAQKLPEFVELSLETNGTPRDLDAIIKLVTDRGTADVKANYRDENGRPAYDGTLAVSKLDLKRLSGQEALDLLTLTGEFEGSGSSLDDLVMNVDLEILSFDYQDAHFENTQMQALLDNRMLTVDIQTDEEDIEGVIAMTANLDTLSPKYSMNINIQKVNLATFKLSENPLELAVVLDADFTGTPDNFIADLKIVEGTARTSDEVYQIRQVFLDAEADSLHTQAFLQSDFAQLNVYGNATPQEIVVALERFAQKAMDSTYIDTFAVTNVKLDLSLQLLPDPFLSDVLVPGLKDFETTGLVASFDEKENLLKADWKFSYLEYREMLLQDVYINIDGNSDKIDYALGFNRFIREDFNIYATKVDGTLDRSEGMLSLVINSKSASDVTLINIANEIRFDEDTIRVHWVPGELVLNKNNWEIPTSNLITYYPDRLSASNFSLSYNGQNLSIFSEENRSDDHLGVSFNRFKISSFSTLFNEDIPPVDGVVRGDILLEEIFGNMAFTANVAITDLIVLEEELGVFRVDAQSSSASEYQLTASLKEGPVDFDAEGSYQATGEKKNANVDLDLNSVDLTLLSKFASEEISESSGNLSGRINLKVIENKISYGGNVRFDEAALLITKLNETFTIPDEEIRIDSDIVYFDKFNIRNSEGQLSTIDGTIDITNLEDAGLDLDISADDFRLINSTADDNELYYGVVMVDFNFDVNGSVKKPKVDAQIRLNSGTNITLVVPESELDIIEKEGVVVFVNMSEYDEEDNLDERLAVSEITEIDLNAILQIDTASVLKVIVDERSGDHLLLQGRADLNFTLEPNGRISLAGIYEVSKGSYEVNLYDIVKRRFVMVPGSTIRWSGDPYNAALSLSAIYRVRTSASDLMSTQLVGADAAQRTMYRQELPFEVYLNINGELMRPEISFGLDMPESQRGALGGNVYARVVQLNENESELNKQVFALTVLNRFLPDDLTGGSSGGGTTAMARSSVSSVLSNQLNTLSDRFVQGVELDFDLDSYTDYQSGTAADRTRLNVSARKSLLDDRLIISVGSQIDLENEARQGQQNASDLIGDISIEYLITDDGRYRVRGFRKNEFEGMVEGLLIVAGVSVLYRREFDRWSELWDGPQKEKKNDNKDSEEKN